MPSIIVTVESTPYAHRLLDYAGPCGRIHGHNARVEAEVSAHGLDARGFVVDLCAARERLEAILARFNHRLLLAEGDPALGALRVAGEDVVALPFAPTAEHLAELVRLEFDRAIVALAGDAASWQRPAVERVAWSEEPGMVAVARRPDQGFRHPGVF